MSEHKVGGSDAVLYGLGELKGMMTSMQASMESHKKDTQQDFTVVHDRIDRHNDRITTLETARHQAVGGMLAAKIIVPLVWSMLLGAAGVGLWLATPFLDKLQASISQTQTEQHRPVTKP